MKSALLLGVLLSFSGFAYAEEMKEAKDHPCKEIKEACEAGGFKKGGHKEGGKGLHVDCMKKLMDGETVAGVTIDAAKLSACKERKVEHKAKKAAKETATK